MPAVIQPADTPAIENPENGLGPQGPFPRGDLTKVLERRWLHYAFLSRDNELAMVANVAWLGPPPDQPHLGPRCTSILLLHKKNEGWCSSQFNARTRVPLWSAFRQPHEFGHATPFEMGATSESPQVKLQMQRSSHPCSSQCAAFADSHFLRWQSESGVIARGELRYKDEWFKDIEIIGYHERVRGYWGWPELGGWVFGFANDPKANGHAPPPTAVVFTLIQPPAPRDAATGSVMLWRHGCMRRHFPRRCVTVATRGQLDRDSVQQVPELANLFGVPPMHPIPRRLVIAARMGNDWVLLDFSCKSAARVVIPSETSLNPFSVHEVIGSVVVEGRLNNEKFEFETHGIVEFAGGADGH